MKKLFSKIFPSAFEMKTDRHNLRKLTKNLECSCVPNFGLPCEDFYCAELLFCIYNTRWQYWHKMGKPRVWVLFFVLFSFLSPSRFVTS